MDDKKDLKNQLSEIETSLTMMDHKIENHIESSNRSHEMVRSDIESIDRRQERLEAKMDSFFESISTLKEEMSKMNINMATYNAQLAEHMRRTALNEARLDKMEEIAELLSQKDAGHEKELSKLKIVSSTVVKVFVAIAGTIGIVWTLMQILDFMYKRIWS
jgi:chromosome segregation ATPase